MSGASLVTSRESSPTADAFGQPPGWGFSERGQSSDSRPGGHWRTQAPALGQGQQTTRMTRMTWIGPCAFGLDSRYASIAPVSLKEGRPKPGHPIQSFHATRSDPCHPRKSASSVVAVVVSLEVPRSTATDTADDADDADRSVRIRAQQPICVERRVVVENDSPGARVSLSELISVTERSAYIRVNPRNPRLQLPWRLPLKLPPTPRSRGTS